jgi:hypothetical protein
VSTGVVARPRRSCRQTLDSCYPIRKVATPVPVAGGVVVARSYERGQLVPRAQEAERIGVPSADHGRDQDAAKHAIRAMSPLKFWLVEQDQPLRRTPRPAAGQR